MIKTFITQQETLVPEDRRRVEPKYTIKVPKKRGRKKSLATTKYVIWSQRLERFRTCGLPYTREMMAAALGLDPRCVNTTRSTFIPTTPEQDEYNRITQEQVDKSFCKPKNLTAVPILEAEDILRHDFKLKQSLRKLHAVAITKEPHYGPKMHYFAFIMPDNCMLHDGVCKGDKIVAAWNVLPSHGDLVVCRIPGLRTITVRRYAATYNPVFFDLYEGGSSNPMFAYKMENLIYGVVVGLERSYWPGRVPILYRQ